MTLLVYINNTKHLNNYVATIQNLLITLMYCKIYILDYLHHMTLLLFADTIVHSNWSKYSWCIHCHVCQIRPKCQNNTKLSNYHKKNQQAIHMVIINCSTNSAPQLQWLFSHTPVCSLDTVELLSCLQDCLGLARLRVTATLKQIEAC